MARTRDAEIRARYNQELAELKEAYKAENNLKVAVGFKQTPEYKRVNKNKRNALYRERAKKKDAQRAKFSTKLPNLIPVKTGQEKQKVEGPDFKAEIFVDYQPVWTAFVGEKKADASDNSTLSQFQIEYDLDPGKVYATIKDYDGVTRTYRTPLQLEIALLRLMRQGDKKQRAKLGYPMASVSRIDRDNGDTVFAIYTELD